MRKGYYIHEKYVENGTILFPGVQKKILEQEKAFSRVFHIEDVELELKYGKVFSKILRRIPFFPGVFQWDAVLDQMVDPDFVYMRKVLCDRGLYAFLKRAKKRYPHLKILIEVPTYPYDQEIFTHLKNLPLCLKDRFYRNRIHPYVDRIVTYSADENIFGIPTIAIQNGMNPDDYPVRKAKTVTDDIHLLAVASFQKAHGYERIIRGMADYYQSGGTRKVILDMVGDGDEAQKYMQLAQQLGLRDSVIFWGPRYGEELIPFFDQADLGLAPFGFYKHGIELSSALKVREYLARGLPVVAGSRQDIFTEETFPYYLEFPNNDSTVDIQRIVDFHDRIYHRSETYETVIQNIRAYAETHAAWNATLIPVMDYLCKE